MTCMRRIQHHPANGAVRARDRKITEQPGHSLVHNREAITIPGSAVFFRLAVDAIAEC
jgi:ABC-type branched-subunit amino acid transport system ATPase component